MTYLFLDLETSGLDPAKDDIVEIAWVLTDDRFDNYVAETMLVEPEKGWEQFWHRVNGNSFVKQMHTDSGLLADLANPDVEKISLDAVYNRLRNTLVAAGAQKIPSNLAGFSVHFDETMLLANDFGQLFETDHGEGLISHRQLDLSSQKLEMKSAGLEELSKSFEIENPKSHRALTDCFEAIGYARNRQSWLKAVTA